MFLFPPAVRVYFATDPVDLRKSFEGLSNAVAATLGQDPLSGHLFVFHNRRRTQVRLLYWDRSGYWLFGKKLVQGTFRFDFQSLEGRRHIEVDAAELSLILEGIELGGARRRKRFRR